MLDAEWRTVAEGEGMQLSVRRGQKDEVNVPGVYSGRDLVVVEEEGRWKATRGRKIR
jgi:ADP-ribose pyrophosphatase YjhB (NUDIX family)